MSENLEDLDGARLEVTAVRGDHSYVVIGLVHHRFLDDSCEQFVPRFEGSCFLEDTVTELRLLLDLAPEEIRSLEKHHDASGVLFRLTRPVALR